MIMVKAEFTYKSTRDLEALDEGQYADLRQRYPDLDLPPDRGAYFRPSEIFVDVNVLDQLTSEGYSFEVSKIKGVQYLRNVSDRAASNATNITNVSVANHNLFCVDTVDWLENACTQELQQRLNAGWRILAVCPPNDARRPDYILGKNSKAEV